MIKESTFPSATGTGDIYVRTWIPEREPRAILQLTHGMAEHTARYDAFAAFLNDNGILVSAQDHAGHGRSTAPDGVDGYFGEKDGWTHLVEDMRQLYHNTKADYPNVPYILMGHSMGSFLARSYAARYGEDMDAFIFSGTAGKNPVLPIAKLLARREIRKNGAKTPGLRLDKLAFGAYGKAIPNARTPFDWLSHDAAIVDAYMQDPKCGFAFTNAGFLDLFDGLEEIGAKGWAQKTANKPMLIISGSEDPVGGKNAKGPLEVADALRRAGRQVAVHIYPGGRHEMLNEPNKQTVYADILAFVDTIQ